MFAVSERQLAIPIFLLSGGLVLAGVVFQIPLSSVAPTRQRARVAEILRHCCEWFKAMKGGSFLCNFVSKNAVTKASEDDGSSHLLRGFARAKDPNVIAFPDWVVEIESALNE
jgi:hypothetical protein